MPASHPADPQRVRVRPPLAALAAQLQCARAGAQRVLVPAGIRLRHRELEQRGQLRRPIVAGNVTVDRPFEQCDRRGQLTREQSMHRRPLRDVRGKPTVVVRACEFLALGEPARRRIPIALDERDPRGNPQRLAALRARRVHRGQDLLEPAPAVAEKSAGDPVVTQEGGQFRAVIEFARRGNRPLQRRHQVRVVASQRRQRGRLTRAAPPLDRANRIAPIVIPVPAPDGEIFTCDARAVRHRTRARSSASGTGPARRHGRSPESTWPPTGRGRRTRRRIAVRRSRTPVPRHPGQSCR